MTIMSALTELRHAVKEAVPGKLTDAEADNLILFIRVEIFPKLMGSAEVRRLLNLGPQAMNMRNYRHIAEGKPGVPDAVAHLNCGYIWFGPDVEDYIAENPDAVLQNGLEATEAS